MTPKIGENTRENKTFSFLFSLSPLHMEKYQNQLSDTAIYSDSPTKLRQLAEGILLEEFDQSPANVEALSNEELQEMVKELRVHQIELVMQNEELRRRQRELEAVRTGYFELYELAPIGYCSLTGEGVIIQVNPAAADVLGMDRKEIVQKHFCKFILGEDADAFYLYCKQLTRTREQKSLEMRMLSGVGRRFWAQITGAISYDDAGVAVIRLIVEDISDRKAVDAVLIESEGRS